MNKTATQKLMTAALCLALGLLLPSMFHMIGAGTVFLPMHIPVLLCGMLCGGAYGAAVGAIVPLLSSLLTGMPPIFPVAPAMMLPCKKPAWRAVPPPRVKKGAALYV